MQICQIDTPEDVLRQVFHNYDNPDIISTYWHEYAAFIIMFMLKPVIIYAVDILYGVKAIVRIIRFYKMLQERQEMRRNKVWLIWMLLFIILSAAVFLFYSIQSVTQLDIILLFLIILINNTIDGALVYYLLSDNYKRHLLYCDADVDDNRGARSLTVHRLEHYMNHNQSRYMDKHARISDICDDFNISADEFAKFINMHYHQMPGTWIKKWRRIREIEQLAGSRDLHGHKYK
jgi:AraC-like DNA-binding protein